MKVHQRFFQGNKSVILKLMALALTIGVLQYFSSMRAAAEEEAQIKDMSMCCMVVERESIVEAGKTRQLNQIDWARRTDRIDWTNGIHQADRIDWVSRIHQADRTNRVDQTNQINQSMDAIETMEIGSKTVINQDESIKSAEAIESIEVMATGYYAGIESTGKGPGHPLYGVTFSGVKVHRGTVSTIAADPNVFPIGTILYIPGYGYGIVADTGSKIKGHIIDLYFETKEQVYAEWGKKKVTVQVIQRGEGKVTEAMMQSLNATEVYAPNGTH